MRSPVLILAVMLALVAHLAMAQTRKITLVNQTGSDIKAVYIAPASEEEFDKSDELLKGRVFPAGKAFEITFEGNATVWDLLVTWKDGSGDVEWSKLKLVPGHSYGLIYNDDTGATSLRPL